MKPALYGIKNSSRNFSDPYYWGKNQFNSSFPVALLCYMRDNAIPIVSLELTKTLEIKHSELAVDDLFNSSLPNGDLYFDFEARYTPFEKFIHDDLKPIDLVVQESKSRRCLRPLEIKLTTLPDNSTADLDESQYGCELVIRNPTMRYMALSFAESIGVKNSSVRDIFEESCATIRNWDNAKEIKEKLPITYWMGSRYSLNPTRKNNVHYWCSQYGKQKGGPRYWRIIAWMCSFGRISH